MAEHVQSQRLDSRAVSWAIAGVLLSLFAVVAGLALMYRGSISLPAPPVASFPAPSVLTDERTQRETLEAQQRSRLAGKNGAIPIGRAMDMVVSRGAKAFNPITENAR
jgi:hypothetical protein